MVIEIEDLYIYDEDLNTLHFGYSQEIPVPEAEDEYFWDYGALPLDFGTSERSVFDRGKDYPRIYENGTWNIYLQKIEVLVEDLEVNLCNAKGNQIFALRRKRMAAAKHRVFDRGRNVRAYDPNNSKVNNGLRTILWETGMLLETSRLRHVFVILAKSLRIIFDRGK